MLVIFKKELSSFFGLPIGYIMMALFLTAVGLLLWVFPGTSVLDYGYAELNTFFTLTPYVLLFLVPAITMRSFAEEFRNGTIELLLTKPLSDWSLVLGKFLANWVLVLVMLVPTLFYYYTIYELGNPPGNIDSAAVFGAYIGLILLSAVFVALSLWASSLNNNQVVAFVVGVFVNFLLYFGLSAIAGLGSLDSLAYPLTWLALDDQYRALGRGLVDSRNVVYLLSWVFVGLFCTKLSLQTRR